MYHVDLTKHFSSVGQVKFGTIHVKLLIDRKKVPDYLCNRYHTNVYLSFCYPCCLYYRRTFVPCHYTIAVTLLCTLV